MESMNTNQAAEAIEALLNTPDEVEEVTEPETEEVEAAEAEETESEETAESEETEDSDEEQGSIETLADLAEALELPLEEVMANLKTTVKVNGEEITVTLKEAFDGYQKDADYRKKTSELAEHRQAFAQQAEQARQQLQQEYAQAGWLVQQLESMVVPQLDPNQLEYLKQTDPAQWAVVKQEHAEKVQHFSLLKSTAQQQLQQLHQMTQAQRQQAMAQTVEKALQELPSRVPSWGKETKEAIDAYLTSEHYGYTPEELAQVVDPRLVELAHKARLWDESQKKADAVKQKVKTLPKVQPAAKAVSKVSAKTEALKKAQSKLKSTGHYKDAAKLIENFL